MLLSFLNYFLVLQTSQLNGGVLCVPVPGFSGGRGGGPGAEERERGGRGAVYLHDRGGRALCLAGRLRP